MSTFLDYMHPAAIGLIVAAVLAALTKITIAWLALREDGVDAARRKDILAELNKMFSWRRK
ncbi:hypothetical protein NLM24_01825 [Nocardia zapadnayensis]|uniref:hypothetical protein n=1 Tax=Nocardia rhamnosiphila TaxID=426716 RepID=UPI00224673F4|nr:hypothetical protein [Nocardia zapadnayensis]MCX0269470.1 hypothetical protein [Nocardia zapadnayensis]